MVVIIFDVNNYDIDKIISIEEISKFNNINEYYTNFKTFTDNDLWNAFNHIILYEYYTFLLIIKLFHPDMDIDNHYKNWIPKFDDLSFKYLSSNYILNNFYNQYGYEFSKMTEIQIKELLKPLGNYLTDRYSEYSDIYSQDKDNFQTFSYLKNNPMEVDYLRQPIVLFSNNDYIGHIYCTNTDNEDARFIGIRESLTNTLNKLYKLPAIKGVGYILLTAIRNNSINENIKTITLLSPIGPMRYIATKFGFIDDTIYNIENETSNMIMYL